jgi:TonB family protein
MRHLAIICLLLNFGFGVKPQAGEPVYQQKEVDKKAVITERIEPGYTEEAQANRVEGIVLLSVILSAEGKVTDMEVVNGLPNGLTGKAVEAAKKVKFIPAMKGGGRVSVRVKLSYYFVLPGGSYYGDSSKKTYYKYGCHQSIRPNDFVVFKSKKEAEDNGYKSADCH